jgi:hypothetical protein
LGIKVNNHSVSKPDIQLSRCYRPILKRLCPFFRDVFSCQINQLEKGHVVRKGTLYFGYFPYLAVEPFNSIGFEFLTALAIELVAFALLNFI